MKFCDYEYGDGRCCVRIDAHRGDHATYRKDAKALDEAEWRADILDELRRLNASLSALPPVLSAIAGGVLGGVGPIAWPALATMTGEPLTLADFEPEDPNA